MIHFVGFRDDRYHSAVKVWGLPDFYHRGWDMRARREIAAGDVVVFATGEHDQEPSRRSFDDSNESEAGPPSRSSAVDLGARYGVIPVKYPKINDNDLIQPVRRGYRMACCDCRLVHEIDFFVVKYGSRGQFTKVRFRARRNNRATAAMRRGIERLTIVRRKK